MAFDGITVSAIKAEIEDKILGGRIDKVYQPEKDEIILGISLQIVVDLQCIKSEVSFYANKSQQSNDTTIILYGNA